MASDNTVWITKTHFPFGLPFPELPFTCDKIFAITRNPIDVFVSMFYFLNSGSHSMVSEEKIDEAFPEEWEAWIRQ